MKKNVKLQVAWNSRRWVASPAYPVYSVETQQSVCCLNALACLRRLPDTAGRLPRGLVYVCVQVPPFDPSQLKASECTLQERFELCLSVADECIQVCLSSLHLAIGPHRALLSAVFYSA